MNERINEQGPGAPHTRQELDERWVEYGYLDDNGEVRKRVILPRFEIISPEIIKESDLVDQIT